MRTTAATTLTGGLLSGTVLAKSGVSDDESDLSIPYGVQTGDILSDRAIVWSRADQAGRMFVEVATNEDFDDARTVRGPAAL